MMNLLFELINRSEAKLSLYLANSISHVTESKNI